MADLQFRPYSPTAAPHVVALWGAAAGDIFPLREPVLRQCLEAKPGALAEDAVLAWENERLIGFGYAGLHRAPDEETAEFRTRGQLQAVIVHPDRRRRGVGRQIAAVLGDRIRAHGVRTVEAGGGMFYLWPGIPEDLPGALGFATAIGFALGEPTWDLRGNVADLRVDEATRSALAASGLTIRPATATDRPQLLAFLFAEFGGEWWHETRWFLDQGGDPADLLLLCEANGRILGLARLHGPASQPIGPPHFWAARRPPGSGGLGPIGVAGEIRGRGFGRALLVVALDQLRVRGLADVVIDFTTLLGYYGPHGFAPWITYREASAPVDRLAGGDSTTQSRR
jgi:GNAT superfamily N-acetyltransferase